MKPMIATSGARSPQTEQQSFHDLIATDRSTLLSVLEWEFSPGAPTWQLSKDHTLNVDLVMSRTPLAHRVFVRKMLAYYCTNFSAASVFTVANALWKYFEATNGKIDTSQLINFKSAIGDNQEYLQILRPFFRRWLAFGFPGLTKDVVSGGCAGAKRAWQSSPWTLRKARCRILSLQSSMIVSFSDTNQAQLIFMISVFA